MVNNLCKVHCIHKICLKDKRRTEGLEGITSVPRNSIFKQRLELQLQNNCCIQIIFFPHLRLSARFDKQRAFPSFSRSSWSSSALRKVFP